MKLGRIERFILGYCATAPQQPVSRQELLAADYGGPDRSVRLPVSPPGIQAGGDLGP